METYALEVERKMKRFLEKLPKLTTNVTLTRPHSIHRCTWPLISSSVPGDRLNVVPPPG